MSYRPDLDGVRCLAVLMVLVFHFEAVPHVAGGFLGVDVFFVLSGFLISSLIWRDLTAGNFSLGTFYVRRIRRLGPALLVVQVLCLVFAALALLPDQTLRLARQGLFTQLYVVNVFFWKTINYFGLRGAEQPLLHCWSLAVEEQFYLVFPLLALGVHRFARSRHAWVLAALCAVSFALNVALVHTKPEATFYLLPTRAWELLAGALTPYVAARLERPLARNVAGWLGLLLVLSGLVFYDPAIAFPGWFALLPVLGAMALIVAGQGAGSLVSRGLSARWMVYVGRISYSLYLVHWPLRVFTAALMVSDSPALRYGGFVASFVLASLLYHFVENPVRERRVLAKGRSVVLAYAALGALVVVASGSAIANGGWRGRFSARVLELAAWAHDVDEAHRDCELGPGLRLAPTCDLGQPGVAPTLSMFGDSHAMALAEAFSLALRAQNRSGQLVAHHGCMPVLGIGGRRCEEFVQKSLAHLVEPEQPENVALVSIWRPDFAGGIAGPGGTWLVGAEAEAAFQRQFDATLGAFERGGKRVYLWMGLPANLKDVPEALARNEAFGAHWPVTSPYSDYERDFAFLAKAALRNRAQLAGTLSAVPSLCSAGSCRFVRDGRPLFQDSNHPARSSAAFFAESISRGLNLPAREP